MSNSNSPPDYAWNCHACNTVNPAGSERCNACRCPAYASARDIEVYRSGTAPLKPLRSLFPSIQQHRLEYRVFGTGLVILLGLLLAPPFNGWLKDLGTTGQLGDFVGGYVGTIFALASVVLLLATLRNQLRASEQQNFENKYFELIKMHRDNVAEFQIGDKTGRKVFVSIMREFQGILRKVRGFCRERQMSLSSDDLLIITYYALFFGVGPNSTRMLRSSLSQFNRSFIWELADYLNRQDIKQSIKEDAELDYVPVDGHQSRLGHYYRHLYQTVTYVDSQTIPIAKYDYIKTIRAQLTNYEQALLLINSLTPLGRGWWRKDLIRRYRMVQNIPRDFFDRKYELDVESLFVGDDDFEWQEHWT